MTLLIPMYYAIVGLSIVVSVVLGSVFLAILYVSLTHLLLMVSLLVW